MNEIALLNISGQDRPGITATLTGILARYDIPILDIGQSVIHDALALGLLVELPQDTASCPMFKDLLFAAHEMGLNLRFTPVGSDEYEQWVMEQGQPKHIVTLLGRRINAGHIARVATVVAENGLNIDQIRRLSGRISRQQSATDRPASVQMTLRGAVNDLSTAHAAFLQLGQAMDVDIAIQQDDIFRRNRRLVCFDMDSTLIQAEVIDELAGVAGVGDQVAAITESAMQGRIDFKESFRRRMALLEGIDEGVLAGIAERLSITEGAVRLIASLKRLG